MHFYENPKFKKIFPTIVVIVGVAAIFGFFGWQDYQIYHSDEYQRTLELRQRIEGKVYSAEDKRALAIFNLEENIKKEKNIVNGFKYIMQNNLNTQQNNK